MRGSHPIVLLTVVQRANTSPARRIFCHAERSSELPSRLTIYYLFQSGVGNAPNGSMKEAGPHRSVYFYHRGDPRSIANGRFRKHLAQVLSKAPHNAPELLRTLHDVSRTNLGVV